MYFSFFFLQNVYKAPKIRNYEMGFAEFRRRFEKAQNMSPPKTNDSKNVHLKSSTPRSIQKWNLDRKLSVWMKFEECEDGDGSGAESESSIRVSLLETAPSQVRARISFLRSRQPRTGTSCQTGFLFFFLFLIFKLFGVWLMVINTEFWDGNCYLPLVFQSLLWN